MKLEDSMRKIFIFITSVIMLCAINAGTIIAKDDSALPNEQKFKDVKQSYWAFASVQDAVYKGYVSGYPDGTFVPEGKVTRAEFLKMVVSAMKLSPGPEGDHWYDAFVRSAISNQIYRYDFTKGFLTDPITREEMALIAVRAIREDIRNQADFDPKRFMYEATKAGLIQGLGKGELGTDKTTTRAQSVAIIERILKINSGEKLPVDKHAINRAEVLWHKTNVFTMLPRYFPETDPYKHDSNLAKWEYNKVSYASSDGNYHEELERFVVVDMADPDDPFRGDVDGFKFAASYVENNKLIYHEVLAPDKSYAQVTVMKQHYNHPYIIKDDNDRQAQQTNHADMRIVSNDGFKGLGSAWSENYSDRNKASYDLYINKKITYGDLSTSNDLKINEVRGLPRYYKDMPSNGGDYFSYAATLFPYGDLTPPKYGGNNAIPFANQIQISYVPNPTISRYVGDQSFTESLYAYKGNTDYSVSNGGTP
jgi:hypothetical protein